MKQVKEVKSSTGYLNIDIPENANLIRFVEVAEEATSTQPGAETDISGMYNIEIPENAELITYKVLPDAEESRNLSLLSEYPEDKDTWHSNRSEESLYEHEMTAREVMQYINLKLEEGTRARRLSEDYLFRKLMDNFTFGTFGGAIYVRSEEVYRLVTQSSLSTLMLSVITPEEKSRFQMKSMPGVFARLTHDPEVAGNALVVPEGRALFLNGAWDIVKRKRIEAKPNELYPFRVQANYSPEMQPQGKYFRKFLATASAGDPEVADRILIMLGYFLVCGFSKTVWVAGCAPNSGKSILCRWLTELVTDSFSAAVPPQDMGSHFVIAQLAGAPVNLAPDISKKPLSDAVVSFLKASSGEDKTVFNQKFQNATSQRFMCKHLFATNYPLKFSYDRALWQRIQCVPFTVSVPPEKQDRKLLKHLLLERDAIVTMAMEAIRRVILDNWQLPPCAVADEMKNSWIGWQVGADEFLSAYCEVEHGAFAPSREMYQQYLRYCERFDLPIGEETGFILHVKKVFPQLDKRKVKLHGVQRNGFCDLKLKSM